VIRVRQAGMSGTSGGATVGAGEVVRLPCDVAVLMCDPEWKIKTGIEIFVFIYRPEEDFSDLLGRWRHTQVLLDKGYEWMMPPRYQHILNDAAEQTQPLFVILPETPERIRRGLKGACLPFIVQSMDDLEDDALEPLQSLAAETPAETLEEAED